MGGREGGRRYRGQGERRREGGTKERGREMEGTGKEEGMEEKEKRKEGGGGREGRDQGERRKREWRQGTAGEEQETKAERSH